MPYLAGLHHLTSEMQPLPSESGANPSEWWFAADLARPAVTGEGRPAPSPGAGSVLVRVRGYNRSYVRTAPLELGRLRVRSPRIRSGRTG